MEPGLTPGDWLLVWQGMGRGADIRARPGQLVLARHPDGSGLLLVKRIGWHEADGWWLTADNPGAGGADSFRFGPVPSGLIEGRVLMRYWPLRRPKKS